MVPERIKKSNKTGNKREVEKFDTKTKFKSSISNTKRLLLGKTKYQKETTKNFWGIKFIGIILIFLIYNLILINPVEVMPEFVNFITIGNPYLMGVTLASSFIMFSILFCNTKFKQFYFGPKSWLKQLFIIPVVITGNYFLWEFLIRTGVNFLPTLLIMAMIWLVFQSFRLYIGARSFSTKTESRFLKKYSPIRYAYVLIIPFIVLISLTVGVWAYRYYLIVFTLDVIAPLNPQGTLDIYDMVVNLILPFLYISLIIIFVLIVTEFILTRKSVNRRSGTFDNFAFSLIVAFMFIYLAYNVTIYLFLNEVTIDAVKGVGGDLGNTSFLFVGEFAISMFFLFRAIRKTGKSFGWNLLFLNQDAMIMIFLASIFAQTTSRLAVMTEVPGQTLGLLTDLIGLDKLIVPVFILVILGITLLIYYIKPQEVSMFMRIAKESVDKEDRDMDIVLKYLRREYIRRGQKFSIHDVEPHLISISNLQRGEIYSLIEEISDKYIDVVLSTEKSQKYIDFVNITDKYESSKKGESKAERLMRERLSSTLTSKKRQKKLATQKDDLTEVEERKAFLTALDSSFQKRIKDEKKAKKTTISKEFKTTIDDVDQDTIDLIMSLIKNEYLFRLNRSEFVDPRIRISEIANKVFDTTKLSPGLLFPLLKKEADKNWNISIEASGSEGDQYLSFTPIDDWEMYESIEAKRPEELSNLKNMLWTWLIDSTKGKKQAIINTINVSVGHKGIQGDINIYKPEIFTLDLFYSTLLEYFKENYSEIKKFPKWKHDYSDLSKSIKILRDIKQKQMKFSEKNQNN